MEINYKIFFRKLRIMILRFIRFIYKIKNYFIIINHVKQDFHWKI
jgi:hypothetical protein